MTIYAENILLCIAIPLSVCVLFTRGESRRFVTAFLIGMGMCLMSAYLSGFISLATGTGEKDTAVFLSPIVEEILKLLPLLFFFTLFETKDRTFTNLAIAIGAGFATFENCCYLLSIGAESLPFILIRGLAVGVMHIESILALAVWMLAAKKLKALSFSTVLGGTALAVTFHAIYNLLVSKPGITSVLGYLLPPVTAILLVLLYRMIAKQAEKDRQSEAVREEKQTGV